MAVQFPIAALAHLAEALGLLAGTTVEEPAGTQNLSSHHWGGQTGCCHSEHASARGKLKYQACSARFALGKSATRTRSRRFLPT
jgi:hypothetical protein